MIKSTVTKKELESLGFKPNQAKAILHDARQIMVQRRKTFWANPRLQVAPRDIIEEVILGLPLNNEEDDNNGEN